MPGNESDETEGEELMDLPCGMAHRIRKISLEGTLLEFAAQQHDPAERDCQEHREQRKYHQRAHWVVTNNALPPAGDEFPKMREGVRHGKSKTAEPAVIRPSEAPDDPQAEEGGDG